MTFIKKSRLKELEKKEWELNFLKEHFESKLKLAEETKKASLEQSYAHSEHEQTEKYSIKIDNLVNKIVELAKETVKDAPTVFNKN